MSDDEFQFVDYYEILGLSENATDEEIKNTYKRLSITYHPDKNTNERAVEKFVKIKEAYDVLSDPEQRIQFDKLKTEYTKYKEQCQDQQSFLQWAGVALVGMGAFLAGYFVASKATKSNTTKK